MRVESKTKTVNSRLYIVALGLSREV
jgi:hypothetical protein